MWDREADRRTAGIPLRVRNIAKGKGLLALSLLSKPGQSARKAAAIPKELKLIHHIFNVFTGKMEPCAPNSTPQFNGMSGKWDMAPPGSLPQFNAMEGNWQMARPGALPTFDSVSGKWTLA